MADASVFDRISGKLEEVTSFNRLEARGTLRIALKQSGLDAKALSPEQVRVVIERVLPQHLRDRGIEDVEQVCRILVAHVPRNEDFDSADSPEAIFSRLGSR
ncbi:MAG TPA: hypothetical protein ENI85_04110 [Deltaproteobacteria bacterium]|nr:hypothetical protein [Deltaproteobacteria bacterium]